MFSSPLLIFDFDGKNKGNLKLYVLENEDSYLLVYRPEESFENKEEANRLFEKEFSDWKEFLYEETGREIKNAFLIVLSNIPPNTILLELK